MSPVNPRKALTESSLTDLIEGMSRLTSVDFCQYKRSFMERRILRQLIRYNLDAGEEYLARMRRGEETAVQLISGLTVNVTRFFRDPLLFSFLSKELFPRVWASHLKENREAFRIWIVGCSTGEEAYSVGISLVESVRPDLSAHRLRIFATDLDEVVIHQARKGEFRAEELDHVEPSLRDKYFLPGADLRVIPELRRWITFGKHDLLKDPFIHHLDMIFCRNVLIFLNRNAQRKICQNFFESLRPGGALVLGKAEAPTPGGFDGKFATLCRRNRVYRKVGPAEQTGPGEVFLGGTE